MCVPKKSVANDARAQARGRSTRPISTVEKRRREYAGCHAQSARVSESDDATTQAVCLSSVSVDTDGRAHAGAGHRCANDRFSTIEKRWWRMPRTVCESVEERWRDGAGSLSTSGDTTRVRVCRSSCHRVCMRVRLHVRVRAPMGACVCVCARECAHACSFRNEMWNQMPCLSRSSAEASPTTRDFALQDLFLPNTLGGRRDRFSNKENQFRCCESVGERWCDGAGDLLTLASPVTPMLARMLAWDGHGTDLRLSRNGDGAVPVAAHSLRECR
jgi:hypothetical protein